MKIFRIFESVKLEELKEKVIDHSLIIFDDKEQRLDQVYSTFNANGTLRYEYRQTESSDIRNFKEHYEFAHACTHDWIFKTEIQSENMESAIATFHKKKKSSAIALLPRINEYLSGYSIDPKRKNYPTVFTDGSAAVSRLQDSYKSPDPVFLDMSDFTLEIRMREIEGIEFHYFQYS